VRVVKGARPVGLRQGRNSVERFEGKVVIVTGGGSGIGAAIAERFFAEGAKLVLAGRDPARLDGEAAKLGDEARVRQLPTNVSKPADMERLIAFAKAEFGRIDVLVNNAGSGMLGRVASVDPAIWHQVIATDLDSVFYGCRFAIPHLIETKGSIVNISSICGVAADPGFSAYNAAKAGVINLTRTIALELAEAGVRANCISPGLISTPATDQTPAPLREKWHSLIPMRRAGRPEEISGLVAFLASEDAGYITGQNFIADGGITAHTGQIDLLGAFGM
jgi:meso-butanediol dehydrogenase/(S,S)-butanediol dehydrogenase/diacetyl reductase